MQKKEYNLKIHSMWRFIGFFTLAISIINILIVEYIPGTVEHPLVFTLQTISTLVIAYYVAQRLSMAKAKISLTERGLEHVWEQRFLFSWEKSVIVPWSKIKDYVFQEDRAFDSFILNLPNKMRYKFDRLNITRIDDDFDRLLSDFPKVSSSLNQKGPKNSGVPIKVGKTIYEQKSFHWLVSFYALFFIVLLIVKITDPDSGTEWGSLGIIGSAVIFYIAMIRAKNKR